MCNGCRGISFGNHGVAEGDCIEEALEQESGLHQLTNIHCGREKRGHSILGITLTNLATVLYFLA